MLWWYKFLNCSDMLLHGQGLCIWCIIGQTYLHAGRSEGDYVPIHDNLIFEDVVVDREHCELSLGAYLYRLVN